MIGTATNVADHQSVGIAAMIPGTAAIDAAEGRNRRRGVGETARKPTICSLVTTQAEAVRTATEIVAGTTATAEMTADVDPVIVEMRRRG